MVTVIGERFIEIETDVKSIVIDMSRIICLKTFKRKYANDPTTYSFRVVFDNTNTEEFGFDSDIPSMVLDLYENYIVNQKHNMSL